MAHTYHQRLRGSAKTLFAGLAALTIFQFAPVQAQSDPFSQFPLIIQCKQKETYHVYYLSRVSQDGVATYAASERIAGTITVTGQAKAVGSASGGSCVGKTLAELRASGQARDLAR